MRSKNADIKRLLLPVFVLMCLSARAQMKDSTFLAKKNQGSWNGSNRQLSIGLGAPPVFPLYFYATKPDVAPTSTLSGLIYHPVLHAKAEVAVSGQLGLGITLNKSTVDFTETYYKSYGASNPALLTSQPGSLEILTVNLRLNYHFLYGEALDPYIGTGAGLRKININSATGTYSGSSSVYEAKPRLGFELTAGLRYLAWSRVGIYAETGLGRSVFQAGITVNLGEVPRY